jgi:hypothetical protein
VSGGSVRRDLTVAGRGAHREAHRVLSGCPAVGEQEMGWSEGSAAGTMAFHPEQEEMR